MADTGPAKDQDFSMKSGDSKNIFITIKDSDGVVVDVTNFTAFTWSMSALEPDGKFSSTVTLSKSLGSGITVSDGLNGIIKVRLEEADTESLDGLYYHETEGVSATPDTGTTTTGTLTIDRDLNV